MHPQWRDGLVVEGHCTKFLRDRIFRRFNSYHQHPSTISEMSLKMCELALRCLKNCLEKVWDTGTQCRWAFSTPFTFTIVLSSEIPWNSLWDFFLRNHLSFTQQMIMALHGSCFTSASFTGIYRKTWCVSILVNGTQVSTGSSFSDISFRIFLYLSDDAIGLYGAALRSAR